MEVAREGVSLLEAIREDLRVFSVKDGCSPQGQCGCCTVLVDGTPRVSCVTPVRRVAGRQVTTADGLAPGVRDGLVAAFLAAGASQCGFCTPGILCRLAPLVSGDRPPTPAHVETALLAHLCRCTGWRSIVAAATAAPVAVSAGPSEWPGPGAAPGPGAPARAALEGGVPQQVGPEVVAGHGGFADDSAPAGCLVAVPVPGGDPQREDGWAVGSTLSEARAAAGKVQGRRSGHELAYPVEVPPGEWDLVLQTTWVEPAYLETDASWCEPGGEPASPAGNGGAFGAKQPSVVARAARLLADAHHRPVRVVLSREDAVRLGAKRPPVAAGIRRDGTGVLRVAGGAPGALEAARRAAGPGAGGAGTGLEVEDAGPVAGPAVSAGIRAAGWAEAAVLRAVAEALSVPAGVASAGTVPAAGVPTAGGAAVSTEEGARARARVEVDGSGWPARVQVTVVAGDPGDETVLRSYVQGAAHMALGWVCSEGIAVGEDGVPDDLTIRSFGVLRAKDTPPIEVTVEPAEPGAPAVKCSDAVFAAVAAATWLAQGLPSRWPTMRGTRR